MGRRYPDPGLRTAAKDLFDKEGDGDGLSSAYLSFPLLLDTEGTRSSLARANGASGLDLVFFLIMSAEGALRFDTSEGPACPFWEAVLAAIGPLELELTDWLEAGRILT